MRRLFQSKVLMTTVISFAMAMGLAACGGSSPKWEGGAKNDDIRGQLMAQKAKLAQKGILATVATATSKDLQTAIDKVELDCRAQMARALETKIENMQKQFKEEVGDEYLSTFSNVTNGITSTVISGTILQESPYRRGKDGTYEVHGLMVLDSKLFKDALAQQMAANQALKARWAASKAYEDLDKEVKEFEEYKKEQGR